MYRGGLSPIFLFQRLACFEDAVFRSARYLYKYQKHGWKQLKCIQALFVLVTVKDIPAALEICALNFTGNRLIFHPVASYLEV